MATETPDNDVTIEKVVYIGRRLTGDNRIAYWYQSLVDDELTEKVIGSYKPYRAGLPVGGIVEIRRPNGAPDRLYTSGPRGPRLVAAWEDASRVAEWRMQDLADAQVVALSKRAKKDLDGLPDEFEDAVNTLARHFARLNHSQRAALLPVVQSRILGGAR
ncbi:hypothetical protein ACH3VR_23100 [Microbacterium sp. B2969]|uniref:ASCH domain-containing protein n=1 Tax=Microbacterium alkaliflavum TaxID=3248839 RepID=A0ABW7QGK1_9MICO